MDIKEVREKQRKFFQAGFTINLDFRKEALLKLKRGIKAHEEEIMEALEADLGKSVFESYATEVGFVYSEISYMLRHLNKMAAPRRVRTSLLNFPSKSKIYREPYGSALIMSPWNYPFQLAIAPLAGAIAAGNCAVVKPSNYSPHVSDIIEKIIEERFREEYIYVVKGGREANENLLNEQFDYIFFTGGKNVGRTVMAAAAKHLTPVTLELGGKSPCIVDESANIPLAARRIVWGKFLNCGQTCVAPDYILVQESVKDKLLEALVSNIEALYGENPIESKDYGKIINQKHFDRLCGILSGEEIYYGGEIDSKALKIGPTIIDNASWDKTKAMKEEIFGPILPVISFETMEEARRQIIERPSPLALYLFTQSKLSEKYFIKNVPFGGGCINDTIMHLASSSMPFGGVGESGMGGYHGKDSFMTFTHEKSILKKSSLIDMPMRYPPYGEDAGIVKFLLK